MVSVQNIFTSWIDKVVKYAYNTVSFTTLQTFKLYPTPYQVWNTSCSAFFLLMSQIMISHDLANCFHICQYEKLEMSCYLETAK
jgi:hypothetical protein